MSAMRLWRLSTISTAILTVLSVVLPVVIVLRLSAANAGPGPVGPDQAGDDWDPHGYVTITAVLFAIPVLAAVASALGRTRARRRSGLVLGLVATALAGLYLLAFGTHLPVWLAAVAVLITAATGVLAIAVLAKARAKV